MPKSGNAGSLDAKAYMTFKFKHEQGFGGERAPNRDVSISGTCAVAAGMQVAVLYRNKTSRARPKPNSLWLNLHLVLEPRYFLGLRC
jgi:hypothetical protein